MKILIPLLLSFAAGSAVAHGDHDEALITPLKPGGRVQQAPAPAPGSKTERASPPPTLLRERPS